MKSTLSQASTKLSPSGPSGFKQHHGRDFMPLQPHVHAKGARNLRKDLMPEFKAGASQLETQSFGPALDSHNKIGGGKSVPTQSKRKMTA